MIDSIRPVLTSALNAHYGVMTKANEVKANANKTLKETVADLWNTHKASVKPAAFRAAVIQIALDAGYTDGKQWGTKILVKIDAESFRVRAQRSDAGDKKGANARTADKFVPFTKAQLAAIGETAKKLKLDAVQIEALIIGLASRKA